MDQGRNNIPLYYFKLFLIIFSTQSSLRSSGGGKQGSYKNNHYLSSSTITMMCEDNENRKKRVLQERERKDIKWMKNNSVSFSYQLPIYHRNTMMACLLLLLLANDCVPLLFFLSRSLILRKYNGMNESPFLLRSQGIPSVRNECHQWWRWDSHTFFAFDNDFFWVFKLLTFFFLHEHHQGTIWMATLSAAFISEKKKKEKEILCNLLSLTSHIRAMPSSLLSIEKYCNDVIDTTLNFFDFISLWNKIFLKLEWKNKPIQVFEKSLHVVVE